MDPSFLGSPPWSRYDGAGEGDPAFSVVVSADAIAKNVATSGVGTETHSADAVDAMDERAG